MKTDWQTWAINLIAAVALTGHLVLGLNSPIIPAGGKTWLIVFVVTMFLANFANSLKPSIIPSVNINAVLKDAEKKGITTSPVVDIAKSLAVKTTTILMLGVFLYGCSLATWLTNNATIIETDLKEAAAVANLVDAGYTTFEDIAAKGGWSLASVVNIVDDLALEAVDSGLLATPQLRLAQKARAVHHKGDAGK